MDFGLHEHQRKERGDGVEALVREFQIRRIHQDLEEAGGRRLVQFLHGNVDGDHLFALEAADGAATAATQIEDVTRCGKVRDRDLLTLNGRRRRRLGEGRRSGE